MQVRFEAPTAMSINRRRDVVLIFVAVLRRGQFSIELTSLCAGKKYDSMSHGELKAHEDGLL